MNLGSCLATSLLFLTTSVSTYGIFEISAHSNKDCVLIIQLEEDFHELKLRDLITFSENFTTSTEDHCLTMLLNVRGTTILHEFEICTYVQFPAQRFFFDKFDVTVRVDHYCENGLAGLDCMIQKSRKSQEYRRKQMEKITTRKMPPATTPSLCALLTVGRPGCQDASDVYVKPEIPEKYQGRQPLPPVPVNLWPDSKKGNNDWKLIALAIVAIIMFCLATAAVVFFINSIIKKVHEEHELRAIELKRDSCPEELYGTTEQTYYV